MQSGRPLHRLGLLHRDRLHVVEGICRCGGRRGDLILLKGQDVIANLDAIPFAHGSLPGDPGAVHLNAIVAPEVFQHDLAVATGELGVSTRDVPLGQTDGITFLPADRYLVPN